MWSSFSRIFPPVYHLALPIPQVLKALPCPGDFERGFQPPLHGTNIHSHRSAIACLQCHSSSGTNKRSGIRLNFTANQITGSLTRHSNHEVLQSEVSAFCWAAISRNVVDIAYTCLWVKRSRHVFLIPACGISSPARLLLISIKLLIIY